MELDKIFQEKAEKPAEEKKLQVIVSEEAVVGEWLKYFKKNKKGDWGSDEELEEYFSISLEFLKSYSVKPELIKKFSERVNGNRLKDRKRQYLGCFLSSLIQTSYNQGFNDFEFKTINTDYFGALLQGQKDNPIKIKAKNINGGSALQEAKNCFLEAGVIDGYFTLQKAKYCFLKSQNIEGNHTLSEAEYCSFEAETVKGDWNLSHAEKCFSKIRNLIGGRMMNASIGCVAEITNYQGFDFGWCINDCTIYSP
ncbi:hypothetical protein HY643_03890, partial [Candidatus Woesearchaeota archaeon]|nr:hypothetical protein [Candidatus Woesearchaeota archaeon]